MQNKISMLFATRTTRRNQMKNETHPDTSPIPIFGGIEGGGTKFNCVLAFSPDHIVAETSIPTTTPEETLSRVIEFFQVQGGNKLAALGVACFGPLDLNRNSPTYGFIKTTTKKRWGETDLLTPLQQAFGLPIGFDTDVNGAAYGEFLWGAAQGLDTFVYLTIGTGIGGGIMANGEILHGQTHTEAGHILIPHDIKKDPFPGVCSFHQDCFEGLASGPAMLSRWGKSAETLPKDHPAWPLEAEYIAAALVNYILTLSPQRIILGGGVIQASWLFPLIQDRVKELMSGYLVHPSLDQQIKDYIVPPALGSRSGVLGAIGLAQKAHNQAAHASA
jgi:fructokinase